MYTKLSSLLSFVRLPGNKIRFKYQFIIYPNKFWQEFKKNACPKGQAFNIRII